MNRTGYCDGLRRRDLLRLGAVGGLGFLGTGLSTSGFLRAAAGGQVDAKAKAKKAIFVNLSGGPSHMDTFDPKPNAPDTHRGEFGVIGTAVPGVQLCEHLPKLATALPHYTILRGVSHSLAAHALGTEYVNTGNRPLPSLEFPGYGAVYSREIGGPSDLPTSVSIPKSQQRAGYLGVKYAPLHTGATPEPGRPFAVRGLAVGKGNSLDDIRRRNRLLEKVDSAFGDFAAQDQLLSGLDRFSEQALDMVTSERTRLAFDVSKESPGVADRFGENAFEQSCLLAQRLVEHDVPFVTIQMGGWDTHNDGFTRLKEKQLPFFDAGLAALFETLSEKGLLDETVVYVTGEFGRTPKVNTTRVGRDHYPRAMFMLMGGGGVSGGRVIGASDERGELPADEAITPDDVAATFYTALGIDPKQEYHTATGRPVMIVRDGEPVPGLIG